MYVPFERFKELTLGDTDDPKQGITKDMYKRVAPMADAIIDDWTLERVGRAVRSGESLPDSVVTLYVTIVESLPSLMDNTKIGKGGLVSSFSNGIDSYSFDVTSSMNEQLRSSLGWMVEALPVEWMSGVVSFKGGNRYAG